MLVPNVFSKLCFFLFCLLVCVLTAFAFREYPGHGLVYLLFTLTLNSLFLLGFRKKRIFFDTFIGIFLWLGFWLKYSVRVAFMDGRFHEPVGNFSGSGAAHDHALLVTSCGVFALMAASFIRVKFLFNYPSLIDLTGLDGISHFYRKYRRFIWFGFVALFVFIAVSNAYFGFYQRGTVPRTILPFKLGGVYTWLLTFGGASISAVLLETELRIDRKVCYAVAIICLLESFFSNASLLSRGMVLNVAALAIGLMAALKFRTISLSLRFFIVTAMAFVFLFGSSVFAVNYIRSMQFSEDNVTIDQTVKSSRVLFLDRWVGIEGVMAISSYPDLGLGLWKEAWAETYSNRGTSFYDLNMISSRYVNADMFKHHFISLPGFLAFFYYPGSYLFLFISLFILGIIASGLEIFTYKLGGKNLILCALIAQVVAYRFAHFGYVPKQSYLLLGTIILNVILIFSFNKIVSKYYKNNLLCDNSS